MFRKTFLPVLAVLVLAANANAGPVYFHLVLNPTTTAHDGIADDGSGLARSSTQSGTDRFHLYALDDNDGSNGIANYSVGLIGTLTSLFHRSPVTTVQDSDENTPPMGYQLGRTGNGAAANPIQASQNPPPLTGAWFAATNIGRTPGNFAAQATAIDSGATVVGPTTNGQWGNYATISPALGKNWVFLAEGAYSGVAPTFNPLLTTAQYFNSSMQFTDSEIAFGLPPVGGLAPTLQDYTHGEPADSPGEDVTAGDQLSLNLVTLMQTGGDPATSWALSNFVYTPAYLGVNTNNAQNNASLNNAGQFEWDTQGANRGIYTWDVTAGNDSGSGIAQLEIHVQFVPEPATLALVGLALVGFIGIGRRR